MSYDITLVEDKYHRNYTSNICKMCQSAFEQLQKDEYVPDYYDYWTEYLTYIDENKARKYLRDLIKELKSNPEKYEKLQPQIDPETGERWGSYDGCIKWLEDILLHWEDGYRLEVDR